MTTGPELGPVGVVAPHMDDAALSCGQMLSAVPGSQVVTVFASGPHRVDPLPEWDKLSGWFKPGDDVMGLRQVEDEAAMAAVGAHGHRLDFWDEQYRAGPPVRLARFRPGAVKAAQAKLADPDLEAAVVEELRAVVTRLGVNLWFIPLGLWHGDHKMTARACLTVAREMPDRRWAVYEELPYRWEVPLEVTAAKDRLQREGFVLEPADFPSSPDNAKKYAMLRCYRSQLPCLGARTDVAAAGPEAFHLLRSGPDEGYLSGVAPELKVAVVIPTFNRRDLVVQAVRSVLGQTYPDVYCLVIDNGSTDGTAEALAAMADPRLRLLVHDRPMGGPGARNIGIAAAEGSPWVAFLDSDDVWAPTKIERQMAAIARHPVARWSATACVSVSQDMQVRHAVRLRDIAPGPAEGTLVSSEEVRALLMEDNRVPAGNSTVLAAKEVLDAAGGFDADLATCDDWDLWLRIAALSPLAYIDAPLAAYRLWDGQSSANERAFIRDAATVRARNFVDAGPVPRRFFARWEREAARRHVAAGRRLPAARSYVRAAWVGASPGQLAYAAAAVAAPRVAERRLRHLESTERLPVGWEVEADPWLAPYRPAV